MGVKWICIRLQIEETEKELSILEPGYLYTVRNAEGWR